MNNRRRLYLINPNFQIKFSLMITIILLISSIVYPLAIYDITSLAIERVGSKAQLANDILESRKNLLIILTLWQIGFLAIVFIVSIFFSHKIAGPIFKLRGFFRSIQKGQGRSTLTFRKGDYFQEIAIEANRTFDVIQQNYADDFYYLEEVSKYLNNLGEALPEKNKQDLIEINKRLAEIQQRFDIV